MRLMSVDDARAAMLANAGALGAETVRLAQADGRALARDVVATRDQPPFAASAMDGWALRAADCPGPLAIVGESAAGHGFDGHVGPGEAVRIFTGAAVPRGADAVIIQENARRDGGRVIAEGPADPRHIRPAGGDFAAGDVLLRAGARLDPWRLSLAAAAGAAELAVARRPKVAILSTGEEVVDPDAKPGPFQIFNSGSTALAALVRLWGGEPVVLTSAKDRPGDVARALVSTACDLIVTLGGASVGDHDLVRSDLASLGLRLDVESVAVRPGKPTFFGMLPDGRRVLGLPGNPASAMVCAELFLRLLLMAFQGADPALRLECARAATPLAANAGREHWMRARLSRGGDGAVLVTPFTDQDSSLVTVFADADALVRRPHQAPAVMAGEAVEMLRLERIG
jgi:molybdopterin molybdotransferase